MHPKVAIAALLAARLIEASPTPRQTSINWSPCPKNITSTLLCADFDVPLDYTKPGSDEILTLNLAKLPAQVQPSRGSVFINTGGPGIPQRSQLLGSRGKGWQLITGGQYDIIALDPRGTGETLPFSCYNNATETTSANVGVPATWTESNTALGRLWGSRQILAERCLTRQGKRGELIGTAFVARDVMNVVDALGEDGMLRFLGYSYGTALGATLAAMFPDRVDKVLLDGVLNMDEYYAGREVEEVAAADATWAGFFKGCMEASEAQCPLKRYCSSGEALQKKIEGLIDTIKFAPIPLGPIMPTDLVDYGSIKVILYQGLYYPINWPYLALFFESILTKDVKTYRETYLALAGAATTESPGFPSSSGSEAVQAIRCGETAFRTDDFADLIPTLQEFSKSSRVIGDRQATQIYVSCAAWQMNAKEIYSEGFNNVKTRNPLLFVGSPYDPLTPLLSAKNVSAAFPGSGLIQHDGYGHASTSQPSLCTVKAINAYFNDGTLPDVGTVCTPSVPIFRPSDESLTDILQPLNTTSKRSIEKRVEEIKLLRAVIDVGRAMSKRLSI